MFKACEGRIVHEDHRGYLLSVPSLATIEHFGSYQDGYFRGKSSSKGGPYVECKACGERLVFDEGGGIGEIRPRVIAGNKEEP